MAHANRVWPADKITKWLTLSAYGPHGWVYTADFSAAPSGIKTRPFFPPGGNSVS